MGKPLLEHEEVIPTGVVKFENLTFLMLWAAYPCVLRSVKFEAVRLREFDENGDDVLSSYYRVILESDIPMDGFTENEVLGNTVGDAIDAAVDFIKESAR